MLNIKRRIIDAELVKIIKYPDIKTLSNKKVVSITKAILRIPDNRNLDKALIDTSLYCVELIAPPYTYPFWKALYLMCKKNPTTEIDFIKLYGYIFKNKRDSIAFYVWNACERKRKSNAITPKDENENLSALMISRFNSYYEGEDYLKEKYPYLNEPNNKIRAYFLKETTPKSILYYRDITEKIHLMIFNDNLYRLINPKKKPELKDKPIFYQLLDTLADEVAPYTDTKGRGYAIKELLSGSHYKAQIHKGTKAQKPKE